DKHAGLHCAPYEGVPASTTNLEATSPNVIPKMIAIAVMPFAAVAPTSSSVVLPLSASCSSPLAIRNRNTPGNSETTEAKPIAANGIRERRATGVRIRPTAMHATAAPAAAPRPIASVHHLSACASMPTPTAHASACTLAEKKTLNAAAAV